MTLYHLYTIAALILALALVHRLFRCAHAWELVDKTEFKSAWEQMHPGQKYIVDEYRKLVRKKVAIVMRCSRCGAAKIHAIWSD